MEEARSLAGRLLLAMPGIGDPRFERSVIAVCAHDDEGAIGIDLGHVHRGLGLQDLLRRVDVAVGMAPDAPVHVGGPVEPRRGFVLHSADWTGTDTLAVDDRWALSGTLDVLRAIAEGNAPRRWVVALGYAGWAAGQLDAELAQHGWFVGEGDADVLFEGLATDRWDRAFAAAGIDPRALTTTSGRA